MTATDPTFELRTWDTPPDRVENSLKYMLPNSKTQLQREQTSACVCGRQYTGCSRNDSINDFVGQFVAMSVCLRKVMEEV